MENISVLEQRVAALEMKLAALMLAIDEQPERDAWLRDIEDETPQKVFGILALYLGARVPGFSQAELRNLAHELLIKPIEQMPSRNVVSEHVLTRTRAIIDEMLPSVAE